MILHNDSAEYISCVSLYDMCYSTLLHFDMEQWDEKITDCINYLILLKALVKEEQAYGSH